MFTWAVKKGYIEKDPFIDAIKIKPPQADPDDYFTAKEINTILEVAIEQNPPLWSIIWLAYKTGGRVGELHTLKWPDINNVQKQLWFRGPDTKNKQRRYIPLDDESLEIILRFPKNDDTIFTEWATPLAVSRAFKRLINRLKLHKTPQGNRSFHTLRHTFASLLLSRSRIFLQLVDS